jgi:hypothetical protein
MLDSRTSNEWLCEAASGDVIAFGGNSFFSKIIEFATKSCVSHVGILVEEAGVLHVLEANNSGTFGVRMLEPSSTVESYDGNVWHLPLSDRSRLKLDRQKLGEFVKRVKNREFDILGSIQSAEVVLAALGLDDKVRVLYQEDLSKLFCSELVAAALRESGVVSAINPSEVTPIDICRFNIFTRDYFQLKGSSVVSIERFNSINPNNFGLAHS